MANSKVAAVRGRSDATLTRPRQSHANRLAERRAVLFSNESTIWLPAAWLGELASRQEPSAGDCD